MRRDEALRLLREHKNDLRRLGVKTSFMFGLTALDLADEMSDIDLYFEHERGNLGYFDLMDVKDLASEILRQPTDLLTRSSLHPVLRERIEASAIPVF